MFAITAIKICAFDRQFGEHPPLGSIGLSLVCSHKRESVLYPTPWNLAVVVTLYCSFCF